MTGTPKGTGGRGGVGGHEPADVVVVRAEQAWDLMAAGYSQREIASQLGVSQPAVSKILHREATRRAGDQPDDDAYRSRLTARHEHLYREAMRAYERSQRDQTRRRQRQTTDEEGNSTGTLVEADVLSRDGDPRFLDQAGRAIDRTARLHGLHKRPGRTRPSVGDDPEAARRRLAGALSRLASEPKPDPRRAE